jgi:glycosyltransferase involved in cell wall biosynthesis
VSVDVGDVAERIDGVEGGHVVPSREPKEIALALQRALAFEGRTNGRQRIEELQLTNEQVARRIVEIYESVRCNFEH